MCVSDNGTELTGMAILRWSQETRVKWHSIAPGKPQQNPFIERVQRTAARRTTQREEAKTQLLAPAIAARTRSGVIGYWRRRTPVASKRAFARAAAVAPITSSPAPVEG